MLYRISKSKLRIGLAATHIKIEQYYVPIFDFGGVNDRKRLVESKKVTAFMPAFNYSYLAKKRVQLYSEVCFGVAFTTNTFYEKQVVIHSIDPAFQCTFIGARVGDRIGAFAELGYGYKGIVQVGISGTF